MNKRIISLMIVMMVLVSARSVIGTDLVQKDGKIDIENKDNYNNPEFYKQVSPAEWKWENVQPDRLKEITIDSKITAEMLKKQISGGGTALSHLQDKQIRSLDSQIAGLTGDDLAATANSQTILTQMSAEQKRKLNAQHLVGYTYTNRKITLPGDLKEYDLEAMKGFGQTLGLANLAITGSATLTDSTLTAGKTSFDLKAFSGQDSTLPHPTIEVKDTGVIFCNGRGLAVGESMITAGHPDKGAKGIRLTIKPQQPAAEGTSGLETYKVAGHAIERKDKVTEINLVLDGTTVKSIGATGTGSFTLENTETKAKLDCKNGKGYIMYDKETGITKYGFDGQDDGTGTLTIDSKKQNFEGSGKNKFIIKTDSKGLRADLVGVPNTLLREKQDSKKVTKDRLELSRDIWTAKTEYENKANAQTPIKIAGKDYFWNGNGWLDSSNKDAKLISTDQLISAWEQGQKQKGTVSTSPNDAARTALGKGKSSKESVIIAGEKRVWNGKALDDKDGRWVKVDDKGKKVAGDAGITTEEFLTKAKAEPKIVKPIQDYPPPPADIKTEEQKRKMFKIALEAKKNVRKISKELELLRQKIQNTPEESYIILELRESRRLLEQTRKGNLEVIAGTKITPEEFARYSAEIARNNDAAARRSALTAASKPKACKGDHPGCPE